jgi:hypothetical protein
MDEVSKSAKLNFHYDLWDKYEYTVPERANFFVLNESGEEIG